MTTQLRSIVLLALTALVSSQCVQKPASEPHRRHVDAKQAAAELARDPSIIPIDIRTPKELAKGKLARALHFDFYKPDFADRLKTLDRTKTYLVYCHSGGRSTKSLATFTDLGFQDIIHLDGGITAWRAAKHPTIK